MYENYIGVFGAGVHFLRYRTRLAKQYRTTDDTLRESKTVDFEVRWRPHRCAILAICKALDRDRMHSRTPRNAGYSAPRG